ncbi:MAG: inorganic pyrophosphatase [Candidatus Eremiobacteraeota bacterium]|nr:inorganic pyrophosphatase [Candidatus Eremiobacteraeota bacterium]
MEQSELRELMGLFFKPHPWHGVNPGPEAPATVTAFIEQVPTDTVKYEIDKPSGYLKLDRPQKFSSLCPSLYGFIPRTYCGRRIGEYCSQQSGREGIKGDGDPIDICVLSERSISHGDLLVTATPIGGIRMIDSNESDDKIIAVMHGDAVFGEVTDVTGLPEGLLDRLVHYFLSYKDLPSPTKVRKVDIDAVYGRAEALKVIGLSMEDYIEHFRDPHARMETLLRQLAR